jgi:hypothetical protein
MDADSHLRAKTIILLLVGFLFSVVFAYLLTRQQAVLIRSDHFSRWYATNKLVMEGRSLYDPQNGREVVSLNSIPTDPIEGSFFYPAHLVLLTLPLAWLPYPLAHFIWLVAIQLFFILGIYWVSRAEGWPRSPNALALYLLMAIFFIPNLQNTIWGQFNTVSVIGLALVYLCLRAGRYGLAGICALSLTFKPQAMLFVLIFLLFWAVLDRRRWSFISGLGAAMLAAWAFAEWLEPNWVNSFVRGVRAYNEFHHPSGTLVWLGGGNPFLNAILILVFLFFAIWNRKSKPGSVSFANGLVLSLSTGWIVVPVLGMMNLVALPLALIWLFVGLENKWPTLYRFALRTYLLLYGLGLAGFFYGLTRPELYGLHIQLSEMIYKTITPILTLLLAVPLCLSNKIPPNLKLLNHKEAV